jgi:hypothetical protein
MNKDATTRFKLSPPPRCQKIPYKPRVLTILPSPAFYAGKNILPYFTPTFTFTSSPFIEVYSFIAKF